MGISVLMESEEVGVIGLLIWFAGTLLISYIINTYFGYLVKAGHVAVIAETFRTGQVPADEVNYGIRMVKSRFATSNIYFVLDRLVSGAVNQLQSAVGKVESFLDFVPGMSIIAGFAKSLIRIGLGYVECIQKRSRWRSYLFSEREDTPQGCSQGISYCDNRNSSSKYITCLFICIIVQGSWLVYFYRICCGCHSWLRCKICIYRQLYPCKNDELIHAGCTYNCDII